MTVAYYILINEHAGSGRAKKVWAAVQPILQQRGIQYQSHLSEYSGHLSLLAEQFAKAQQAHPGNQPVVLVIGGDGSLNEALNGLMRVDRSPRIPLAYLPAGSGNDFARGAKLATDPLKTLEQVLGATKAVTFDIGAYTETLKQERRYFVNNLGIGFDATIVDDANQSQAKRRLNRLKLGKLAYLRHVIKAFDQQEPFPITVHIGQKRYMYPQAFLCTTSNHPYFGGGVPILPGARIDDGTLELIVVEKPHWWQFIWLFIMLALNGRHLKMRSVHHFKSDKIHLLVNSLEVGQLDGEIIGNRNYDLYLTSQKYPFWFDTTI